MVTATENLWGSLPGPTDKIITPKRILQEQAQILSDVYDHRLVGEVSVSGVRGMIEVSLYIVAPTLNNYHVLVARAHHPATVYPVFLEDPLDSLSLDYVELDAPWIADSEGRGIRCDDESGFRLALSKVLGSEKVHTVVKSLYSQIEQD
jgi:hypothetical protein